MVTIRVKGGTPEGAASLCASCRWGVVRLGYRVGEEETFCRLIRPNTRVPFTVRQCSDYSDRSVPSLYSMEKIGWVLLTKSAGRSIGFVTSEKFREVEGEDAEIIPETVLGIRKGGIGGAALGLVRKVLTFRFFFAYSWNR